MECGANFQAVAMQESCQTRVAFFTTQIVFGNKLPIHSSLITKAIVSYPDPHRSCGWITSPLCRTNFWGSGYETTKATVLSFDLNNKPNDPIVGSLVRGKSRVFNGFIVGVKSYMKVSSETSYTRPYTAFTEIHVSE